MNPNYLQIIRNLAILKQYLALEMHDAAKDLFKKQQFFREVLFSNTVYSHNIHMLEDLLQKGNYTELAMAVDKVIAALQKELFKKPCSKAWNTLLETTEEEIRFCMDCNKNVFKVKNQAEFSLRKMLNQCVFYKVDNLYQDYYETQTACVIRSESPEILGVPRRGSVDSNWEQYLPFQSEEL